MVFQSNSLRLKRKENNKVNDGNLHVYINRDTFLLSVDFDQKQWKTFDFFTGAETDLPQNRMVHK